VNNKLVLPITLIIILMGVLGVSFKVEKVKADSLIYIRVDGSVDPPTAPISTTDNITYTFVDNFNDFLVVERDNIVIDGAGYNIQVRESFDFTIPPAGISLSGRNNVTIQNMKIEVYQGFGIRLSDSSSNIIFGIDVTNSYYGINLYDSSNNVLRNNSMAGNIYNFGVYGQNLSHFINDVDASNTVNGKRIYYWVNRRDVAVPLDAGYVALINCTHVTVENLNLTQNNHGILLVATRSSTVAGTTVMNNLEGIMLFGSSNNTVFSNNVTANHWDGIALFDSSNNTVSVNNVTSNNLSGILLLKSSTNSIYDNYIKSNGEGINLWLSSGNMLRNNSMINNHYNFEVAGESLSDFLNDVDVSNTIDSKPVYYWINRHGAEVPLDAGYVALVNCTEIVVRNLNLTRDIQGLLLISTQNSCITTSYITNNFKGIVLDYSSNHNNIFGNKIRANKDAGILLSESSKNNIYGNDITDGDGGHGMLLSNSSNNNIYGNNFKDNSIGIYLKESSSHNNITINDITNNYCGIWLWDSSNNIVSGNNITKNTWCGIELKGLSSNNKFYYNNFVDNAPPHVPTQVYIFKSGNANIWDNGYPSGGNYWSDYNGTDLYSGSHQNATGGDGIGDTPYIINDSNQDNYPLANPYVQESQETRVVYRKLLSDYNELQGNYDSLQAIYNNLQAAYDLLNFSYNDLNTTLNELKSEQEATINELNNIRNLMYIFIATTMILTAATVYSFKKQR